MPVSNVRRFRVTLSVALIAAIAQPAQAQRPNRGEARESNIAGQFDYYALTLSWSPTYCATKENAGGDPQCNPRAARPYAFVLHGLWPQYERGWPESCRIRERPYVPRPLIDRMLDIMPSPRLVIHEYRKHGTCSGLNPEGYFDLARRLYERIEIPSRYKEPADTQFVSPNDLADELISLNPGLRPDMLAIVCDGAGNRLREVRICFTRDGEFRSCGRNENQRRLCSASRMFVPPVRAGRASREREERGRGQRRDREDDNPREL